MFNSGKGNASYIRWYKEHFFAQNILMALKAVWKISLQKRKEDMNTIYVITRPARIIKKILSERTLQAVLVDKSKYKVFARIMFIPEQIYIELCKDSVIDKHLHRKLRKDLSLKTA